MLEIFDNFYAMQHGPVESDIYNAIAQNSLVRYKFSGITLTLPNDVTAEYFEELDNDVKAKIDSALTLLEARNENILQYDPFKLVDISHLWNSWRRAYEVAELMNKGSEKMNIESIRRDQQYFA